MINLSNRNIQLNEAMYSQFSLKVREMLLDLYHAGFRLPTSITGTQAQIDAFMRALQNEKLYMDAYMKHGLGDSRTMMSRNTLNQAVGRFERETGLRWPFKN